MTGRPVAGRPAASCPDCLSFGACYGSQSYCRACYDFTRRYPPGECADCARIIAIKKGHCRLCWLQAGITATGRRITPADFRSGRCWQLSFAGMSQLGHASQRPGIPAAGRRQPPAKAAGTQPQLPIPGESLHFDKAHWVASAITNQALHQARHIAAELAGTRGWNPRIITEAGRALTVVLADHIPGDMIAWSALPAALRSRDLSITRTAEILGLAGLLHDDRIPSFTALARERLALLPAPPTSGTGCAPAARAGPAAAPATSTPSGRTSTGFTPCCSNGPRATPPARGHHRRHHRRHRATARKPAPAENWLTQTCRGLTATLERLRVDRQLDEALTCGADPLHLAAVFGIDDTTAIRYATIARQLLQTPAEQHHPRQLPRTQGPEPPAEHEHP